MDLTRKKNIGRSRRLDEITEACGGVWCDTVRWFWRSYDRHGTWLSKYDMQKWMCTRTINTEKKSNAFTHPDMQAFAGKRTNNMATARGKENVAMNTAQAVVGDFYDALRSWKKQDDEKANPPKAMKSHHKATWNYTQITLKGDTLKLQTPRGEDSVCISWPHTEPKRVEIGWQEEEWEPGIEYEMRVQFDVEPDREPIGDKTIGVDLGEKHLAAATDGEQTWLVNGAEVRSLRRYQNKLKGTLQSKIDTKEPGSRRFKRLVTSKNKQLASLRNQIRDVLHKLSRRLVETLFKAGASTLVFGDIAGIRDDLDHGTKQNQRMHQWVFGSFRRMVKYKARLAGLTVAEDINEAYTSSTCPCCGDRSLVSRNWAEVCEDCGVEFHHDEVGSLNIRKKYLDGDEWLDGYLSSSVVADKGSTATEETPRGEFASDPQCSSPRGGKTNQLGLFASGDAAAPSSTRETPARRIDGLTHPVGIRYRPHMDCGPEGSPAISSEG